MKEKLIETVKEIIDSDYNCSWVNGEGCRDCPASSYHNKTDFLCQEFFCFLRTTKK